MRKNEANPLSKKPTSYRTVRRLKENRGTGRGPVKRRLVAYWEKTDKRYIWHPFTQMQEWASATPLIIEEGKGVYLKDVLGRWYLDGVSSLWVNIHGHRRKEIDRAIEKQLKKIAHSTLLGATHVPAIDLAKQLVSISPKGLSRVFYSDDGSTAMEIALKMAYQYWLHQRPSRPEKKSFLSLFNAYHGDTIGTVSVGGIDLFHQRFKPLLFPSFKSPSPYCYRCHLDLTYPSCELACVDDIETLLKNHRRELAAVVLEPKIQAAAGMLTAPPGYLARIRDLCTRYDVLLILDEVATGFGRTGTMFACQEEKVTPDLMAISKGITGGYLPLAATLTTEKIFKAFLGDYGEFKTFFHGHSYTGNPLGCAAALANLQIFKKENLLKQIKRKASNFGKMLKPLQELDHVGDIRQAGLMVGIELVLDRKTKAPFPLEKKIGIKICDEAREKGLLLRPLGNVIVLVPPLATPEKELRRMVEIVSESIRKVTEAPYGDGKGRNGRWK